jgi:WD40 repeat protein
VFHVEFSPDGALVAMNRGGDIKVIEAGTGKERASLAADRAFIQDMSWGSRDRLASLELSGVIRIWDVNRKAIDQTLRVGIGAGVAFLPGGKQIAFIGLRGLSICAVGPRERRTVGTGGLASRVAFLPGGDTAVLAADGLSLIEVRTGKVLRTYSHVPAGQRDLGPLVFLPGGRGIRLLVSDNGRRLVMARRAVGRQTDVAIWETSGRHIASFKEEKLGAGWMPLAMDSDNMALSPDGEWLVVVREKEIVFREAATGTIRRVLPEPGFSAPTFGAGGELLVCHRKDRATIEVVGFSVQTGEVRGRLSVPGVIVHTMKVTADGRLLLLDLTGCSVYDLRKGTLVSRFSLPPYAISAFSSDGSRLVTAGIGQDQSLHLWDVETGQQLLKLEGAPVGTGFEKPAFSPDGRTLALPTSDGLRIWESDTPANRRVVRIKPQGS